MGIGLADILKFLDSSATISALTHSLVPTALATIFQKHSAPLVV